MKITFDYNNVSPNEIAKTNEDDNIYIYRK